MLRIFVSEILRLKQNFEPIIALDMLEHPFKITVVVSFNKQGSTWLKDLVTGIQKGPLEKSLLVVSGLRPWIRKEIKH